MCTWEVICERENKNIFCRNINVYDLMSRELSDEFLSKIYRVARRNCNVDNSQEVVITRRGKRKKRIDYACGKKSEDGIVRKQDVLLEKLIELAFAAVNEKWNLESKIEQVEQEYDRRLLKVQELPPKIIETTEEIQELKVKIKEIKGDPEIKRCLAALQGYKTRTDYLEGTLVPALVEQLQGFEQSTQKLSELLQAEKLVKTKEAEIQAFAVKQGIPVEEIAQVHQKLKESEEKLKACQARSDYLETQLVPTLVSELTKIEGKTADIYAKTKEQLQ